MLFLALEITLLDDDLLKSEVVLYLELYVLIIPHLYTISSQVMLLLFTMMSLLILFHMLAPGKFLIPFQIQLISSSVLHFIDAVADCISLPLRWSLCAAVRTQESASSLVSQHRKMRSCGPESSLL